MTLGAAGSQLGAGSSPAGGGETFSGNDTLESLGLVDPQSGRALPTTDWSPPQRAAGASDPQAPDYRQDRYNADPWAEAQPEPAGQSTWESDENPYKAEALRARQQANDPARNAREQFQTQAQAIDSQAQAAFAQLVASGMPAEQAQIVVGAARQAAITDAQMKADRLALLPAAKREVSERIAREFSLPNAKIDASELLSAESVDAMRERARTLQGARRGQAFDTRRTAGTDRVERGAAPGSKIDYESLSPFDTIRLGIARGQFT